MVKCTGKSVLKGIAVGRICLYRKKVADVSHAPAENVEKELERFDLAVGRAKEQLAALYENALKSVGEEEAMIFDVHSMMLEDEGYLVTRPGVGAFAAKGARERPRQEALLKQFDSTAQELLFLGLTPEELAGRVTRAVRREEDAL